MRSLKDFEKRVRLYEGACYCYIEDYGLIAWQVSTGENVELLFIEVMHKGYGHATQLVKQMCKNIKPFNSVFVVRLESNKSAGKFYRKLGFKEHRIEGLYKENAVLGTISYEKLCQNLSIK